MKPHEHRPHCRRIPAYALLAFALFAAASETRSVSAAGRPATSPQAYAITIDPTALVPQSWWQIPGITPSIWESDPETSDAYRTSRARELTLQPGQYKFISFTFDFPFEVTSEGTVDYSPTLDQCVNGRGTHQLIVRCKRTYPFGGQPEYRPAP